EARRGIDPSGAVESEAASGNDVVYVFEVLSPGMEHAEESDVSSQVLGIACEFEQRSGAGTEEQIVEQSLVLEDQSGERVWQSEDDVEVWNGQQLGRTCGQPFCAHVALTLGAVPIAA